jgi:hypothetical protein
MTSPLSHLSRTRLGASAWNTHWTLSSNTGRLAFLPRQFEGDPLPETVEATVHR